MTPDEAFDTYLTSQLGDEALPDQTFSGAVASRIGRYQRRRRFALGAAFALAFAMVVVAASLSPVRGASSLAVTPETIVGVLILVAICSVVWIGTESRTVSSIRLSSTSA